MNLLRKILFPALLLMLLSCSQGKLKSDDTNGKLKKSDKASEESAVPSFSKLIVTPPPPQIGGDKTISFSVTDQIPLKDVLIELGRVAKIDVDVDSSISGGIVINAKNRPLKEVIDRIATMGKLRYSYQNGVLHFERDAPYSKNYFVDFLSGSQLWTDVESNISAILSNASDAALEGDFSSSTPLSKFTSNKSAGIIAVYATKSEHDEVSKYLADVYKTSSSQVLIEAKVVEVTLSKAFASGIDWSIISGAKSFGLSTTSLVSSSTTSALASNMKLFGFGGNANAGGSGGTLGTVVKALETFGDAKAISSPRINAINNQKATLDFSQKKIYFTIAATSAQAVSSTATSSVINSTITATKNEVDIGVKLEITPSINLGTNEITLDIKPKLSIDSGETVDDPSVNPSTGDSLGNKIPIINTRELSTIAKVQSGNILVIGGLMSQSASDSSSGIPILSRIPVLKYLFGYNAKSDKTVETVIFIKATIINSSSNAEKHDRGIYNK